MIISNLFLAFQFTSPGPIIFQIGSFTVRWYGLLIAFAVLIGVTLSQYLAKKRQLDPDIMGDLAIWLVVAAIPCARLYYVIFQWSEYAQRPGDIIAIWKGGIAIHGAIIGGVLATLIFAKVKKLSFWQLLDLVVPSAILGQAIGRWGNFFNSEAFGPPTDLPWKLYIPKYVIENGQSIARRPLGFENIEYYHPTFLYESLWDLFVLGILIFLFFRGLKGKPILKLGTLALVYMVGYSAGRFWIEALRTDSLMLGSLRIAQVISMVGICLGVAGLIWLYLFKRNLPDILPANSEGKIDFPGD
ncbi:prolipoprotein diacylglyceryl transferase [Merismopedia glauca]|uniref:Phosphatidylglycerol--prolipoprotein diacylglyceryl transferase n=2 Tax=Merismopedia TaxID=53402 RepID=A0A2T1C0Z6_9CYAN|nr:prolipoprotein diacylglyceryl transferase [Merismopedia glauca]PSB01946.1 prolipoprotein diacylglyceryl transferase [Merismopedia glauca CCAP 1448/3]